MGLVQKEVKKVYMWKEPYTDYSAMQGPCPSGFHMPTDTERTTLYGILTSTFGLASNATTMGTYLKMPMAGERNYQNSNVRNVSSYGNYWCSTAYGANYGHYIRFNSSSVTIDVGDYRSYGLSIRAFKDVAAKPTSSWTVLYQGTGNAGIFWNSTDGLISVSGDGITWYTIQDKNLGATSVYNQGNNETDANCGYFYQWGNNYGFPHSGTVTTSSTRVDASSYGPGNYYNSSTFIYRTSSPEDRSSVQNDDLRGGETGPISGGGDILIRPVILTTTDYTTSATYSNTTNNRAYYYGVKFTALKSGSIKSVGFFTTITGTLKIAQGSYASAAGTQYNVNSASSYTLSTPYQITAGQNYVVVFIASTSNSVYYKTSTGMLPATGTAVKYDYATISSNTSSYTDRVLQIKSLTIDYIK